MNDPAGSKSKGLAVGLHVLYDFGGTVVGSECMTTVRTRALFVEPNHIGKGIGRGMLQHALNVVAARSGESVLIQGEPNAEKFYLAAGAKQIGTRESGSIPGRTLPLFEILIQS